MRPLDGLVFASSAVLALILLSWLSFALSTLFVGFPRLRIGQVLGIVAMVGFMLATAAAMGPVDGPIIFTLFIPVAAVLIAFAGMWSREFRLLMLRRSDEFPDRLDKLAWVFVLTAMAPIGVWLFRSYRKARWPEAAEAARPHPLDEAEAGVGVDASGLHRIGA